MRPRQIVRIDTEHEYLTNIDKPIPANLMALRFKAQDPTKLEAMT